MSSPSIDRLVASRGPALVSFNGGFFFSKEDIVVDLSKDTKVLPSSAFGPLTEINLGVKASTKLTPVGEFEHLGVLWPYGATLPGTSIFGNADTPLLIQPLDTTQKQVRFFAAGISKMPDLNFTASDTLIGELEIQMIGKNNTAVDDAARLFQFENNALDTGSLPYDPTKLIIQPYLLSWLSTGTWLPSYNAVAATGGGAAYNVNAAAVQAKLRTIAALNAVTVTGDYQSGFTVTNGSAITANLFTSTFTSFPAGSALKSSQVSANVVLLQLYPWSSFNMREGVKVAFNLQLDEDTSDAIGHYDTIFRGLSVTASGIPQGIADADAMNAAAVQGSASVRGSKISSSHNLDVSGSGVYFRLYGAGIKKAGLVYSASKQRLPEFQWAASRSIGGGGALNPLFAIDVNPIA